MTDLDIRVIRDVSPNVDCWSVNDRITAMDLGNVLYE